MRRQAQLLAHHRRHLAVRDGPRAVLVHVLEELDPAPLTRVGHQLRQHLVEARGQRGQRLPRRRGHAALSCPVLASITLGAVLRRVVCMRRACGAGGGRGDGHLHRGRQLPLFAVLARLDGTLADRLHLADLRPPPLELGHLAVLRALQGPTVPVAPAFQVTAPSSDLIDLRRALALAAAHEGAKVTHDDEADGGCVERRPDRAQHTTGQLLRRELQLVAHHGHHLAVRDPPRASLVHVFVELDPAALARVLVHLLQPLVELLRQRLQLRHRRRLDAPCGMLVVGILCVGPHLVTHALVDRVLLLLPADRSRIRQLLAAAHERAELTRAHEAGGVAVERRPHGAQHPIR
eukprot:scaffold131091_cov72-Phaeocystis_antarctica.AAC.1